MDPRIRRVSENGGSVSERTQRLGDIQAYKKRPATGEEDRP